MKLSRKQVSAVLELVIVLLATALVFRLGVATAKAERGYDAHGGEYLLLTLPALYYAGKQTLRYRTHRCRSAGGKRIQHTADLK